MPIRPDRKISPLSAHRTAPVLVHVPPFPIGPTPGLGCCATLAPWDPGAPRAARPLYHRRPAVLDRGPVHAEPRPYLRAPNLGAEALLIDRGQRGPGSKQRGGPLAPDPFWLRSPTRAALPAPEGLEVIGTPHTWSVRLLSPVENAAGYRIYRNRYQPTALNELGLPLGDRWSGAEVSYEDALALEPGVYWYSVTATDGLRESPNSRRFGWTWSRPCP